ncbi:MAG: hypothetical protein IKV94_02620 [Clostridia bacterium]|nr:hypothetical protein [Clostridia bacterium]MBR6517090.1 hypothetical protein [Bacilli bacterium]
MFIDRNSIQIKIAGMNDYISLGQYLVEAKYSYNKLWANDSGRNLAGVMSGTLVGIFPKIILQFRALTKTELEIIAPILDASTQSLKYYDPKKKATVTIDTYTGDWEIINKNIIDADTPNEGFGCSFISVRKRS